MSIKLDLSRFRYHSSDNDTTTLVHHKDGHTITLARKALSKGSREQLEAMSKFDSDNKEQAKQEMPKQQKLAEGGTVNKYADGEQVLAPQAMPEAQRDPVKDMLTPRTPVASDFPTQEEIQKSKEAQYQEEVNKLKMAGYTGRENGYSGQDPMQVEKVALDNIQAQKDEKEAKMLQVAATEKAKEVERSQLDEQRKTLGLQPVSETAPPQELQAPVASLPTPESQQTPIAQPATNQSQMMPASQDAASFMQAGYKNELTGITGEAAAKGVLGEKQADVLSKQIDAQNIAKQKYDQEYSTLEAERKNLMQDIKDGHVDPNKFWTGDPKTGEGGHSKVATAIGMIIAGFNPAGTPNAAIEFLNKQMERNLDSQAKNLQTKNNLLAENLRQFGNLKDATAMTRIMQSDIVQNQLLAEAAKATNPLAKAAALKAAGQLQMQSAPLFQNFAMRRAMMGLANDQASSGDPSNTAAAEQMIAYARVTNPEVAKEMESRLIPNVGMAKIPVPQDVRQQIVDRSNFDRAASNYINWVKKHAGTLSPGERAAGATLAAELQGMYRQSIKGGVFKEGEQDFIEKIIPSDPAQFLPNIRTTPKIEALLHSNRMQLNGLKSGYGIPQTKDESPQIKIVNGVKYMRGPNGKAIPIK